MNPEFRYRAFISYSHVDAKWAKWLHRALEGYRTPRRLQAAKSGSVAIPGRLTPIFRDRDELATSHDLSATIRQALDQSENLIVICSPTAAGSRWVNQEIEAFKQMGRSERIYCLIVDGDPSAIGTPGDCFPPALRQVYNQQGQLIKGIAEPIAADARDAADGKKIALLKIIAGLLQVGLDDLRQRELQRRNRRMLIITASSLLASVVTIALAVNATLARNEARQRQQQAEELLGFMVGDLRRSLEPLGRLDLLESVGKQATAYFAAVNVDALSTAEMNRQAEVLNQLGQIRLEQFQYQDALTVFTQAYERSAALVKADPDNVNALFNRGQAEFWVGFVNWRNGSFEDARTWLTQYRDTSMALVSIDSGNADWLREVGYGYHNLAVLAEEQRNWSRAEEGYRYLLRILEQTSALEGSNDIELRRTLADVVSRLGNLALTSTRLDDAENYYQRSVDGYRAILAEDPRNAITRDDLAYAIYRVAQVEAVMGKLDEALELIDESDNLFSELVSQDSENLDYLVRSSFPQILKSSILLAQGKIQLSETALQTAVGILEDLNARGDNDYQLISYLADAYTLQAQIAVLADKPDQALDHISQAVSQWERLEEDNTRLNNNRLFRMANTKILRGILLENSNQPQLAQAIWQETESILSAWMDGAESYHLLDPMIRILILTNRSEQAKIYSDALDAHHYIPLVPWPN